MILGISVKQSGCELTKNMLKIWHFVFSSQIFGKDVNKIAMFSLSLKWAPGNWVALPDSLTGKARCYGQRKDTGSG